MVRIGTLYRIETFINEIILIILLKMNTQKEITIGFEALKNMTVGEVLELEKSLHIETEISELLWNVS